MPFRQNNHLKMENKVNSKISTCDLPACTVLVYRNKVQNGNFPPACRAAMTRFHAFASQHDLRPCFGPSAVGVGIAPAELGSMPEFYEAGCMMRNDVPVRELVPNVITGLAAKEPGEGFFIREVPAGTWAKYLLRGSFEQLAAAYPALAKWVQDSGKWMVHIFLSCLL